MSQKFPRRERCCPDNCQTNCNPDITNAIPPLQNSQSSLPIQSPVNPTSPKCRIRVLYVDPMLSVNGPQHHTDQFSQMKMKEMSQLVVRRGQPFLLLFKLDRDYSPEYDAISLTFLLEGETVPKFGSGTEVIIPVFDKADCNDNVADLWYGLIDSATDKYVILKIQASTQCIVGEWKMEIDTKFKPTDEAASYVYKHTITILFNAWNPSDQVYMENEQCRKQCILSEAGVLETNGARRIPWFFGQFQNNILKIATHILSAVHPVRHESRHDAVYVTRALSGALNSNRDSGVLVGKWVDDFLDGMSPRSWVGSVKILQEYYRSRLPVKYGQCWVFSALCTTVCRALGIPARPVTVLNCAHDSDGNFLLDFYFDDISKTGGDSIWDFHVVTEVWMRRPDVSDSGEFDGWNVVDCAPLTRVGNNCLCGPAPVRAIRHGEIQKAFDTDYLYTCVNADVAFWKGCTTPKKLVVIDTRSVGSRVLTQSPVDTDGIIDVTEKYKFPEGSKEERINFEKVIKQSQDDICRYSYNQAALMCLCISVPNQLMIGSGFEVELKIFNLKTQSYCAKITLNLYSRDYTGRDEQLVKRDTFNVNIQSRTVRDAGHIRVMKVYFDDYKCFLRPSHNSFSVYAIARVDAIDYDYICSCHFSLGRPNLVVCVPRNVCERQEVTVTAQFDNPLPVPLTRGQFTFEGTDCYETIKLKRTIPAKSKVSESFKWRAKTSGDVTLMASFICQELGGIYGYTKFSVY